jgi:hypothetical protein
MDYPLRCNYFYSLHEQEFHLHHRGHLLVKVLSQTYDVGIKI